MDTGQSGAGASIDAKSLLRKYAQGTATAEERLIYEQWYTSLNQNDPVRLTAEELAGVEQDLLNNLLRQLPPVSPAEPARVRYFRRMTTAAAVLLLASGAFYFLYRSNAGRKNDHATFAAAADIAPGKNTATLQLADGRIVQLSEAKTGVVINAASLSYNDGSQVDASLSGNSSTMLTASTPRGGTYQFILSDGTRVWLNADSRLVFASPFTGAERRVKLEGEAFFEVNKDATHPFIVETNYQSVKVLGTSFNINSYTDEPAVKTTLLEGSVQVLSAGNAKAVILQPGEQSVCGAGALHTGVAAATDVEQAIAWKNGDFVFDSDIQTIMKQIARWYDVEVTYKGPVPTEEFGGKISRSKSIKQVLRVLESTNSIHFEIKERRITVMQ